VPSVAARLDRGLAYYVAGAAVLALLVLYLLQAAQVTAAGYRIERLQAQQQDLLAEQAQLRYEEASLQAPARVQAEASRTGLQRIAPAGYVPYRSVALDVSGGATSEPAQAAPFWARLLAEIGFRAA
jgi:cell division protein FtsL